jgi:hypothetical protein
MRNAIARGLLPWLVRGRVALARTAAGPATGADPIQQYVSGGRVPWSPGYSKFKNQFLSRVFADGALMDRFRRGDELPVGYGPGLDERVVECPWTIAHLRPGTGRILDAGSVFNTPLILRLPAIRDRTLIIYSLDMDWMDLNPRVSYLFGDFRESVLRDALFETIVCISTLEHVGMWPTPKPPYQESLSKPQPPADRLAYRRALTEFRRMLVPGGQLLLTVPCGQPEDHGWLQVYDSDGIADIKASFAGECKTETYYRYRAEGWQRVAANDCVDCEYFNIVRTPQIAPDNAAAARAVVCLELVRPS